MRGYVIAVSLLILIFGGIAAYLFQRFSILAATDFSPPPVTVSASFATNELWPLTLQAVGAITAVRGVQLTSEQSGEIVNIAFESGQQIEAGALMVALNDTVEQASRKRYIANLELARQLYTRDEQLVKQKSVSQTQLDRSKADLDSATAQLAETEAQIEKKRIHAPFSGTAGIRNVKLGDYVSPGTIITTLQDLRELEVDFTVPARHYPLLRPGLSIDVRVAAFTRSSFPARLDALDSRVDPDTGNLALRARLLASDGLLPGMFAELDLDLDAAETVVTVPETAITYSLQGNVIYLVEMEQQTLRAVPRVVRTGATRSGRVAVLDGLEAGARVVSSGQNKLYRGAEIVVDSNVDLQWSVPVSRSRKTESAGAQ